MKNSIKFTAFAISFVMLSSCKKPEACISSADTVEVSTPIEMSSCSINAKDYEWNMGDGTKLSGSNISHTYNNTGVYQVELIAGKGNKESKAYKTINVVGPNAKFVDTWTVNEDCDGGLDFYTLTIEAQGDNQILIHNFLNANVTVSGTVTGNNITLNPQNGLVDGSGDMFDLLSGSGTLNGNTVSISYSVSDVNYGNWFGLMSCTATYTR